MIRIGRCGKSMVEGRKEFFRDLRGPISVRPGSSGPYRKPRLGKGNLLRPMPAQPVILSATRREESPPLSEGRDSSAGVHPEFILSTVKGLAKD